MVMRSLMGMGIVLLLAGIIMAACGGGGGGSGGTAPDAFNASAAYSDLETIVGFGPRPPGSAQAASTRALIVEQLELLGIEVRLFPFVASTPIGPINMVNVVGVIEGTLPDVIILSNHYDTKIFNDFTFVGANDGGSTTAWMIEMARSIGATREGHTIWLTWFDGEEAIVEWSATDSLYGSREMVRMLQESGDIASIRAQINVDMIGDCQLGVHRDLLGTSWIQNIIWDQADVLGFGPSFLPTGLAIQDDHIPFLNAGIPAANLIDFRYGGGLAEHEANWHTVNDQLDLVCAESLNTVGEVILSALPEIDRRLVEGF
jgi:glutaminyl-peptide cyclotransferase